MVWSNQAGEVMAPVVAEDWLWGLEFTLNYAKNEGNNVSMPGEMIVGAYDYYNWTKQYTDENGVEAAQALGLEKFLEMVGIAAPNEKTIVYTLTAEFPYFGDVASGCATMPISGKLLEQIGAAGYHSVTAETLWYNGPYILTEYIQGNTKTLTKNPNYWNKETKIFDTWTQHMVEDQATAFLLFQTGEIDAITLTASQLKTIYENPSNELYPYLVEARPAGYSYQLHFVYSKNNEDGTPDVNWNTAVANENFRKAIYYGMDLTQYLAYNNFINPYSCENYGYTMVNLVSNSENVTYDQMVRDAIGLQFDTTKYNRFDAEKAAAYKAAAIEELTAKGVTFPVVMDYYVMGGNQGNLDQAEILKQIFAECLGEDFITFNIKSYVSSLAQEVRNPRLASVYINGWGADFNDPINFLGQETYNDVNAYYATYYSNINDVDPEQEPELIAAYKEFTELTKAAAAITDDTDARYAALAKAEACFLEHALTIPMKIDVSWELTCYNDYTHPNTRYVDLETNAEIWQTADYQGFKAKFDNGEY